MAAPSISRRGRGPITRQSWDAAMATAPAAAAAADVVAATADMFLVRGVECPAEA